VPSAIARPVADPNLASYTVIDLVDNSRIEFSKDYNSLPLVNFKVGLDPCLLDGD
jgi:hypothetical protein